MIIPSSLHVVSRQELRKGRVDCRGRSVRWDGPAEQVGKSFANEATWYSCMALMKPDLEFEVRRSNGERRK